MISSSVRNIVGCEITPYRQDPGLCYMSEQVFFIMSFRSYSGTGGCSLVSSRQAVLSVLSMVLTEA